MLRSTIRRLLAIDDPPERTAFAFSVGVFIAFSPLLGLHTILATLLAVIFRFNKIAIYAGTLVNNPLFTMVPIILASYSIGALLLGRPLGLSHRHLELLEEPHLLTADYWRALYRQDWDVLAPFALGGLVLSCVCSVASYPLTLRLLRIRDRRKESE
jgi:uncharacterized protein (DUF2062 family)